MPRRRYILTTSEYYHLFNRSIGNEEIFCRYRELNRIVKLINYYRFPQRLRYSHFKNLPKKQKQQYLFSLEKKIPLSELYCFALMPNHYHFLLKQTQDKGIVKFISNVQNSYAKFFNLKNSRHGSLFQHPFKAKRIETDEEFIHISRYIHLNPVTSYLIKLDQLTVYPWTSLPYYLDKSRASIVETNELLKLFKSEKDYLKFVTDQADYQSKLHLIKNFVLE